MRKRTWVVLSCVTVAFGIVSTSIIAYAAGAPSQAKYVGVSKCRACHMKAYKTWRKTKHAKVFEALQDAERKDPDCLKCHTTGYGKASGFVSEDETPSLKNVGCEACHGPGSAHVKLAKTSPSGDWDKNINRVPQNTCINCHNPHVSQKKRAEKLRKERSSS